MKKFTELNLLPEIQQALDKLGFEHPTEIQEKAIPVLAQQSADFHGQAQTGTGKTLAFGIPLLQRIDRSSNGVQALIVAPTRELVTQINDSLKQAAQCMPDVVITSIYGGVSIEDQIRRLKKGVHIVVGTPGRLNDHLRKRTMKLDQLKTLVLDEADIMLDMGFREEIDEILKLAPKQRNIWLFSATVKAGIKSLMASHMKDTISIRVSQKQVGSANTEQFFSVVHRRDRVAALTRFIDASPDFYGFVFCQTKMLTADVADNLNKRGYSAYALHGDMNQAARNKVIERFKNKRFSILVATDVAARGIDVSDVSHVVNFSFPEDHESYVHRVGRTGRAGKTGTSITFVSRNELRLIKMIQNKFNINVKPIDVPSVESIAEVRVGQAADYLESLTQAREPKDHAEKLYSLLGDATNDQLKKFVVSFLNDKYLKFLNNDAQINFVPADKVSLTDVDHELQEVYLNVGSDDGLTQDAVVDFIAQNTRVAPNQLQKIKLIKRRCYLVVAGGLIQELTSRLRGRQLGGRRVMVFMSDDFKPEHMRSRGGRSGGRSRSRSGSGRSGQRPRGRARQSNSSNRRESYSGYSA